MVARWSNESTVPQYAGLRMSADEFIELPHDGFKYELVEGVVVMSPSPGFEHQQFLFELAGQLHSFLRGNPIGRVLQDYDVRVTPMVVYEPDLVFVRKGRLAAPKYRINFPPDVVVEVLSSRTFRADLKTKREDYERFGVSEYWILDPIDRSELFLRLEGGRYVEVTTPAEGLTAAAFASRAIPGFVLDLSALRGAAE
jgi:Uma2 family endonuclease